MPKRRSDSLQEPQALFDYFRPQETPPPPDLATGGDCSFASEPKTGRATEKVREFGQVATPRALAEAMAIWATSSAPAEILDPGLGLGNLLQACRPLAPRAELVGIEIDPDIAAQARRTAPPGTRLHCGNYLRMRIRPCPAIIANPPYIKAARADLNESDWACLEELFGCRLDRLTNAYALFLLKIWHDLAPGGRAAVLIPGEFLNANYGVEIKRQLLRALRPVATLVLDPAVNAFDTALTTSAILLLEKTSRPHAPIPAYLVRDLASLQPAIAAIAASAGAQAPEGLDRTELSALAAEDKWLNRILGHHAEHEAFTHRVGDFFRCSRGIATGANDYFCLRPSEIAAHGLSVRDFLPCVTKAPDIGGLVFDAAAHAHLQAADKRCWLLAPAEPDSTMRRYLALGQSSGIADKFLPSHRPVWYLPENRAAAHAWIAVFSRDTLKCVLNDSDTRHLTCFHGVYARSGRAADAASLVLFLNSSLGRLAIRQAQRFYGDGLNKLEPKDVEAIPCPSFGSASAAHNDELITELRRIQQLPAGVQSSALEALAHRHFALTPQAAA